MDGRPAEADRQVGFADARRAVREPRFGAAPPGAGGAGLDAGSLDDRLDGDVKGLKRLARWQGRQLERGPDAPLFA
ncbi:MAG: hypothetical protein AAF913_12900, partial [Pseudomonadota bacterium]